MLVCDKCNAGINKGSKFCPQCGDPVTEEDQVSVPAMDAQVAVVEIEFGQSSSANFTKALDICKKIPSYAKTGEDKTARHSISLAITEVDLIINLFDLVGSWKSSNMLINGQTATKKDLTYYGVGCYRTRQGAYLPEQYCFGEKHHDANIWGCKRLNMPIYEWGGGWLDCGEFDSSGNWIFDKDRIRHDLERTLKENELCPILNRRRVLETLDQLPISVNPQTDPNWAYQTRYESIDGRHREVAVGIKPVLKKIDGYVLGSFTPSWNTDSPEPESFIWDSQEAPAPQKKTSKKENYLSGKVVLWVILGFIALLYLSSR